MEPNPMEPEGEFFLEGSSIDSIFRTAQSLMLEEGLNIFKNAIGDNRIIELKEKNGKLIRFMFKFKYVFIN